MGYPTNLNWFSRTICYYYDLRPWQPDAAKGHLCQNSFRGGALKKGNGKFAPDFFLWRKVYFQGAMAPMAVSFGGALKLFNHFFLLGQVRFFFELMMVDADLRE